MWRLIWAMPSWIIFWLFRLVLILLGYVMVPLGILFGTEVRASKKYAGRKVRAFRFSIFWLWGNEEEGVGWYGKPTWPTWVKILYSEVWRNPANNVRYVPILSVKIDLKKVKYIGSFGSELPLHEAQKYDSDDFNFWVFVWCGFYSNIRFHFEMFGKRWRFWMGWKVYAEDAYGVSEGSHRIAGAGFASQFKRIAEL